MEMLGLDSIQSFIRKRKLQWMAHCARRGDKDLTWKRMTREVEDGKSKCGTNLKEEWKALGVETVRGWCNKAKDKGWLASKLEREERRRERRRPETGFYSKVNSKQHRCEMSSLSWVMRTMSCGRERIEVRVQPTAKAQANAAWRAAPCRALH